jgi:hypothetical protein
LLLATGGGLVAGALIGTGIGAAEGVTEAGVTIAAVTAAGGAEAANSVCSAGTCIGEGENLLSSAGDDVPEIENEAQSVVQDGFGNLSQARQFGIDSYNNLRNQVAGMGYQVHHIIDQRFGQLLGFSQSQMNRLVGSVVLTTEEHQLFTDASRAIINYGQGTASATVEEIYNMVQKVYEDYPALLEAAKGILIPK